MSEQTSAIVSKVCAALCNSPWIPWFLNAQCSDEKHADNTQQFDIVLMFM